MRSAPRQPSLIATGADQAKRALQGKARLGAGGVTKDLQVRAGQKHAGSLGGATDRKARADQGGQGEIDRPPCQNGR